MPTTTTKLEETTRSLAWRIEDAQKDLAKAADALARRAAEAQTNCQAMLRSEPTSTMWVSFLGGDYARAQEALAHLERLVEQQRLVAWLARGEDDAVTCDGCSGGAK